jgi:hypothetical protein
MTFFLTQVLNGISLAGLLFFLAGGLTLIFGLTVRGTDYVYPDPSGGFLSNFKNELTGCGPFLHDDPADRPAESFSGRVTLHTGPDHPSHLLLPVIPRE